ncbi:MAG: hypothetical protein MI810_17385, partial [Flavobacteriales bacterium]|nr:hypothetical protein [Flavobacteriales bacterium]
QGEFYDGPTTVNAGQTIEAFEAGSTSHYHGVTGWVQYELSDGSNLYIMFNNPHSHDGTGSTGNQWLYACTDSYSKYSAVIDSSGFIDPVTPMADDTISPIVNVYLSEDLVSGNIPTQTFSAPTGNYVYLYIVNNSGFPLSLSSMTNGYDSPPVSEGNPPFVANTVPVADANDDPFLALFAVGGIYSDQETSGTISYNLPSEDVLSISWSSDDNNSVTASLGGSGVSQGTIQYDQTDSSILTVVVSE